MMQIYIYLNLKMFVLFYHTKKKYTYYDFIIGFFKLLDYIPKS